MKRFLLYFLFVFIGYSGYSQGKLYTYSYKHIIDVQEQSGSCMVDNYSYSYDISHEDNIYSLQEEQVLVRYSFREWYNDIRGEDTCNGPCGYSVENEITEQRTLSPYFFFYYNYEGPNPITCAFEYNNREELPITFSALYMPDYEVNPDTNICTPLFASYDGQLPNLSTAGLQWQYSINGVDYYPLPNYSTTFPLDKSIEEIFGENYNQFLGSNNFLLRYAIFQGTYYSDVIPIDIIDCSYLIPI